MSVELKSYQGKDDGHATPDEKEEMQGQKEAMIQIQNGGPEDENDHNALNEEPPTDRCALWVYNVRKAVMSVLMSHWIPIKRCVYGLLLCLYFGYFVYCMHFRFGDEGSIRLLVCTVLGVLIGVSLLAVRKTRTQRQRLWEQRLQPLATSKTYKRYQAIASLSLKIFVFGVIAIYIIADVVVDHPQNLIAVVGQAIFIVLFFVFSTSPARVNWHTVFWGFALQYILALIILRQEWGFLFFKYLGDRVSEFLLHSDAGAVFMFSDPLVSAHIFAFKVLPIIIFFYTMISIFYYLGVMQFIVRVIGRILAFSMDTTPAESLNAAGNIFVGMIEAPLMIAPLLKELTCSEIHAVMTGGFATIAGGVLGAYISFGVPANHLISASVMSAPAALAISKLAYPEVEVSKSTEKDFNRMGKAMPVELKSYDVGQMDHTNQGYTPDNQDEIRNPSDVTIQMKNGGLGDKNGVTNLDEEPPTGRCALCVYNVRESVVGCLMSNWIFIRRFIIIVFLCLYFAYFGYCMYFRFGDEGSIRLLVCTVIGVLIALSLLVTRRTRKQRRRLWGKRLKPCVTSKAFRRFRAIASFLLKVAVFCVIAVYIILDVAVEHPQNLIAVAGQAIYIIIFFVFSVSPAKIKWHTVFWGFALQYILALIILRQDWGFQIFKYLGDRVSEFLKHSDAGAIFLFSDPLISAHIFAFTVLPIVIFFYTMISILYYLGVMQFIVRVIGRMLAFSMDTTPAESLNAAGNIFVGMTEAPLMIGPFLKDMTCSELHAVMTGGFATIAGSVLGAYVSFGVPANHLISASVMSAPAALAISKLAYPEVEVSKSTSKDFNRMEKAKERSVIEAATAGASASTKLVAAIAVNIIAFLSLLNFVNATLVWCGERAGVDGFTLEFICSYVFFPIAYFMGTELPDCRKIAELIGIKTFTNEFIAYQKLAVIISNGDALANYTSFYNETAHWYWDKGNVILNATQQELVGGVISNKSEVIATYALCGFSNFGSIGILLGALGALVPSRKSDLTRMVVRAMISGTVACFLTACIAGLLYKDY